MKRLINQKRVALKAKNTAIGVFNPIAWVKSFPVWAWFFSHQSHIEYKHHKGFKKAIGQYNQVVLLGFSFTFNYKQI